MRKAYTFIFIFCSCSFLIAQTAIFGGVSGLSFRKYNVKESTLPADSLTKKLMNFHVIQDTVSGSFFKKLSTGLNQSSLFVVSNKLGGTEKKIYGKIGSSVISSIGIDDFNDSLRISSSVAGSKILTFTKNDSNHKIYPIVFLNKRTDHDLLIPEILIFNTNLSAIDMQKIETYLSIKYGITINDISEKNYVSSANEVIWDSKKNKNYNFRITGIGRDDLFGLHQKQSKNSDDDHIVVSLGQIKATNSQNSMTLNQGSFLLWGDNNQSVTFKDADLISAHPKRDMMRMWKVQVKNTGSPSLKTQIYLNIKGLQQNDKLKLRIFTNENNYQSDVSTDIVGEKINDSLYVFKDAVWDNDLDGIDYFTFNLQDSQSDIPIQLTSTCDELGNGLVKISVPESIFPFEYSLKSTSTNQEIINTVTATNNSILFNNLPSDKYQLNIHRPGQVDIIRTFDLEGIANQNIDDYYTWKGTPIELDLNTDSYQYTLNSPSGKVTDTAPYMLNGLGDYKLIIKNKLGCEVIKTLSVLNQSDYDALESNSLFKKITVAPNPSHDGNLKINIKLKTAKPLTIKIFNSLGVLVRQGQYSTAADFTIPMNIPAFAGYYNIKIFIPGESKGVNFLIN